MTRVKIFFSEHRLAFLFAGILALVVVFPQVYFRVDQKQIYQGIELLPDSPWSPRITEVQNGHPGFGSIYYKDGKDDPYLFQPLGSMIVGYGGEIFGLGINNTILASRIVLSFIVFLLFYCFVYLFSKDKITALVSATILLFADSALSYYGVTQILQGLSPESFLRIARPLNPAMIYVFFFGFLVCFWFFYKKQNWRWGISSAILLGLNFYNYFYSWTFLYAFGAILALFLFAQKRWREVVGVVAVFVGALVVAIPYVINLHKATLHPVYQEASIRFGVIASHSPEFVGLTAIIALVIFYFLFPKEDGDRYFFGLALLITPFITLNQQIITGKILQEAHYHWFFHKPLAVIVVVFAVFYALSKKGLDKYKKALAVIAVVGSIGVGIFVQGRSYFVDSRDGGEHAIDRQKYGPVVDWLNTNALKESVVLSNDETSHVVAIYTPLNLFYHRAGMYSLAATRDRLLENIFTFYRLRGISAEESRDVFLDERGYISSNIYGMHYRELLSSYDSIPVEEIDNIVQRYKETFSLSDSGWLKNMLAKYEVEYVVWDMKSNPTWRLDRYPFLTEMARFGDMAVYGIK